MWEPAARSENVGGCGAFRQDAATFFDRNSLSLLRG
jgi:hypothetical protein